MNERSIQHATFVIERTYGASPSRVFAAWADTEAKAQWFPMSSPLPEMRSCRDITRSHF